MKVQKRVYGWMGVCLFMFLSLIRADETSIFTCEDGVKVSLERPYKNPLPYGAMPVRVEVLNPYSDLATWTIKLKDQIPYQNERSAVSIFEFSVPSLQTRSKVVWMDLQDNGKRHSNRQFEFSARGPGVSDTTHENYSSNDSAAPHGIWVGSEDHFWSLIPTASGSEKSKVHGANEEAFTKGIRLGSSWLPADWRSFSALSDLWIYSKDWENLQPGMKEAIQIWVRMGGQLHVATVEPMEFHEVGLGNIRTEILNSDGKITKELFEEAQKKGSKKLFQSLYPTNFDVRSSWFLEMAGAIGKLYVGIIVFAIIFMVIMGPVNLYRFAPLNRRARLFWTVPLISFSAVLLLFAIIYFKDGFGGEGKRNVLAYLVPEENRVGITQEQACRTGLLWNRTFSIPEEVLLRKLISQEQESLQTDMESIRQGGKMRGDWFVSRSRTGHQLRGYLPTRFRFEFKGGETPLFVSSIQDRLEWCFWIDAAGEYWKTGEWEPGQEREFVKTTSNDFHETVEKESESKRNSDYFNAVLQQVFKKRNILIARGGGSEGIPVPTFSKIQWKDDLVYYVQEVQP